MTNQLARKPYPSDVTDAQWMILAPLIPEPGAWSPREPIEQREIESAHSLPVANGLLVETDAPRSARARKTVYHYIRKWKLDGTWEKAMTATRRAGANPDGAVGANPAQPSSIASRSKPVPCEAPSVASTVGKQIFGRKRHLLVDTQGLILAVLVHAANLGDRDGARLLLQKLVGRFPRLCHLFADHGYTGPLITWIKELLGWETEIRAQAWQ